MRKLSDFYKDEFKRSRITERLSSLTFIEVDDGVYDVLGDAVFSSLGLNSLLEIVDVLKELTSSKVPIKIRRVRGNFWCSDNNLKDLQGAPEEVKGNFHCYYNYLETLDGAPKYLSGDFECWGNRLKDLKGAPQSVGGSFDCSNNQLISLVGAPRRVEGNFICHSNYLQTLQGAPEYVGGYFDCIYNLLHTLEGAPKYVGESFYCYENPEKFTEEEVRKLVNVKEEVWTDKQRAL